MSQAEEPEATLARQAVNFCQERADEAILLKKLEDRAKYFRDATAFFSKHSLQADYDLKEFKARKD